MLDNNLDSISVKLAEQISEEFKKNDERELNDFYYNRVKKLNEIGLKVLLPFYKEMIREEIKIREFFLESTVENDKDEADTDNLIIKMFRNFCQQELKEKEEQKRLFIKDLKEFENNLASFNMWDAMSNKKILAKLIEDYEKL